MSLRPGTPAARELFVSKEGIKAWTSQLEKYNEAVELVAIANNKKHLVALDSWLHNTYSQRKSNSPLSMEELEKIMEWKLCRGKDRPTLRGLIKQNTPKAISESSISAFELISRGEWLDAIKALSELRGVGPATASAILAPLHGNLCSFMADEVLEAATGRKREYSLKAYSAMQQVLLQKAAQLNTVSAGAAVKWTPESVGKAMWVASMMSIIKQSPKINATVDNNDDLDATCSHSNKKRKRS